MIIVDNSLNGTQHESPSLYFLSSQRTGSVVPGGMATHGLVVEEEEGLPFKDNTFDLAVSSLR